MKTFDTTTSFCPICKKVINADIVEKNGAMFMQKTCPEHGSLEVKIAKYAWYYKGLNSYYDNLYGRELDKKLPTSYLCNVTSKCSLDCPICFAKPSKEEGISMDFLKEQLRKIENKKTHFYLGGNESTEREDLPEIIRLIKKFGHASVLLTNGIKIAEDLKYLKLLKDSGLNSIATWVDSLKNPEIYIKMRGADFLEVKMRALENMKKLKMPAQVIQVLIKDFNESEIEDVLEFARKNDFINNFWVRGYQHMGKLGFSSGSEFLPDEIIETVANQTKGLFALEDVYYFQKMIYIAGVISRARSVAPCYSTQMIIIPRDKEKSLRETFNFEKFSKVLDEFEKIWPENRKRAKRYFVLHLFPKLLANPFLSYLFARQRISGFDWNTFSRCPHYLMILMNVLPNILNYDIRRYRRQCKYISLNAGVEKHIPDCYNYCLNYNTLYCHRS